VIGLPSTLVPITALAGVGGTGADDAVGGVVGGVVAGGVVAGAGDVVATSGRVVATGAADATGTRAVIVVVIELVDSEDDPELQLVAITAATRLTSPTR
jgi:hypothetical protein